jgi:hypothetical protein
LATPSSRSRFVLPAALAAFLVGVVVHGRLAGWNVIDDALITCRVAANAAAGFGPVFNPGVRFESWSSPAWVALLTAGARLGMDLPWLARALGVIAAIALVVIAARLLVRIAPAPVALAGAVALAADAGLAVWCQSGLETACFTLLLFVLATVVAAAAATPSRSLLALAGLLSGSLALVRPEGFALGAVAVAIAWRRAGGERLARLALVGPALVVAGALTAWRVAEYGAWLPASASAKLALRPDAIAAGAGALLHGFGRRFVVVAGAVWMVRRFRPRAADLSAPAPPALAAWRELTVGVTIVLAAMVLLSGGDWMGHDRLILPVVPLLVVAAVAAAAERRLPGALLFLLGALAVLGPAWQADRISRHGHAARRLGEWLSASCPDSTYLGVAAAGAIPFHSGFRTIDALGIADPHIARTPPAPGAAWTPGHMHYDTERFLAARPDIIVWEYGATWSRQRMEEPSDGVPARRGDYRRELLRHPAFRAGWRPMPGVPDDVAAWYSVFRRVRD